MYIIRLYLEEWNNISDDVRCDIQQAIRQLGYIQRLVTYLYIAGFSVQEISRMLQVNAREYLLAAIQSIQTQTGYSDYAVLKAAKGEVKRKWLDKCNILVQEF